VDVCELADLGYEGRSWTFEKHVAGGSFCRVRLDRALATTPWSSLVPLATLSHLMGVTSDQCLILLRWKEYERQCKVIGEKIFRYEVMWEHHEQFKPFLDDVWQAEGRQRQWTSSRENSLESLDHWVLGAGYIWARQKGDQDPQ
jgi:hypothetical protein